MSEKTKTQEHNDLAIENQYLRHVIEQAHKAPDEKALSRIIDQAMKRIQERDGN